MNGMNRNIRTRILALDPNVTVTFNTEQITSATELQKIRWPDVDNSLQFDSYDLIIRTVDGQFRGANAIGYNEKDFKYWNDKLKSLKKNEEFDSQSEAQLEEGEIAVGVDIARMLGLLEGDQVTLIPIETLLLSQMETPLFSKVTVKKIVTADLQDIDANIIFFNRDKSLKNFSQSLSKVSGYNLWLNQENDLNPVMATLKEKGFRSVESWKDKNSSLFFALLMEKTMIGVFLGLAGLIASTSVLTVLALIMSQKQSDIAIIKTLGLSDRKTLVLFTKMGLWISLSAVVVGTFLGLAVSYYLENFPLHILPHIYYDASIPAAVDLRFGGIVIFVSCVLALLGCYLPAKSTLNIQPAILLKQKN